ncbi:MAG: acyltransferase domain-containing protein [Desulfobacteraceae bacterium]|nr:acyltransferase domain-containing protein [Desulfobacteraceae bacterium]
MDTSSDNAEAVAETSHSRGYHIPELVVWHGQSPETLLEQMHSMMAEAETAPDKSGLLKRLAFETQQGFSHDTGPSEVRVSLTAYTESEFLKKAAQAIRMISEAPDTPFSFPSAGLFYGMGEPLGRIAFLFPGQGAQYPGMGGALANAFPAARKAWETLGNMAFSGHTIREVVFPEGTDSDEAAQAAFLRLSGADWASPCISVAGEAIFTLLEKMGVHPDAVAAHSFGDINALRAAGVFGPEQMIRLTRYRGELGVSCPLATRGCILAVPEPSEKTRSILAAHNIEDLWIANYNTRQQTVLSGEKESVDRAQQAFADEGIKTRMIPISAAPHCPLAANVAENFYAYLADVPFGRAQCDVYSFLFGRRINSNPDLLRKVLRAHIKKPVRFFSQIEQMHHDGIRIFVELGPGNILTTLVGQILEGRQHIALNTDHKKADPVLVFLNVVAELFKQGRIQDLSVLREDAETPDYAPPADTPDQFADPAPDAETEKRLKKLDMEISRIESMRSNRAQTA